MICCCLQPHPIDKDKKDCGGLYLFKAGLRLFEKQCQNTKKTLVVSKCVYCQKEIRQQTCDVTPTTDFRSFLHGITEPQGRKSRTREKELSRRLGRDESSNNWDFIHLVLSVMGEGIRMTSLQETSVKSLAKVLVWSRVSLSSIHKTGITGTGSG